MPKKKCNIALICVGADISAGIYDKNFDLIQEIKKSGRTSEVLPKIFQNILDEYEIENVAYARGPGNFSAIKLTHVFLQTLTFIKNIKLFSTDSFYFTNDEFIHAYGKIHFQKINGNIESKMLDSLNLARFALPKRLNLSDFSDINEPLYILPAV